MDTTHAPTRRPRKRSGAPRGNQNGRKHGRYSRIKPADHYAPLQKMLKTYGLDDVGGLSLAELLDDPNTNVRLLYVLMKTTIELVLLKDRVSRL